MASDLVSRGIDIDRLDNVINYDVPSSSASYVHRVGRTARAGREGSAFTLVTRQEAGWFLREIGGEEQGGRWRGRGQGKDAVRIKREREVEKIKVSPDGFAEADVKRYEEALSKLGEEARGTADAM